MPRLLDIAGQQFARLAVTSRAPNKGRHTAWKCVCTCGNKVVVLTQSLTSGRTKSCGCLLREKGRQRHFSGRVKHGHCAGGKRSRTYRAWHDVKTRCHTFSAGNYAYYGGQGISMCDAWRNDFRAFLRDMGECLDGLTIERRDPFGNYEPSNCCWATWEEQARNKRRNHQRPINSAAAG